MSISCVQQKMWGMVSLRMGEAKASLKSTGARVEKSCPADSRQQTVGSQRLTEQAGKMNLFRFLYNVGMLPLATTAAPLAYLAYRLQPEKAERWRQRLGFHSQMTLHHRLRRPLVWIHAVSVGEVGVASTLLDALNRVRPDLGIIVSTTTPHGQELARRKLAGRATCIYFPLDLIVSVRRTLRHIRPDIIVCLETELWPNFLGEAHRLGIPTLLINGRISKRSFPRYRKLRPLMASILRGFSALAMVSDKDAERIIFMGAPADKVVVAGNMKGAGLAERAIPERIERLRQRLHLSSSPPVLIAGSIRNQELIWLPEIFCQLAKERADLIGIFAPRHPKRLGRLETWFQRQGLAFQRYSVLANGAEARRTNIILVDSVGVLFELYGLADLVFCGGSLVPLGGQNILEPAAWGKAVFYGPNMDNFPEARQLLEAAGSGITVQGRNELLEKLRYFLAHPEELENMGSRGKAALSDRHQVALKQAELILGNLDQRAGPRRLLSEQTCE
ncbi:MAG: 3-deoxy-D-manno-octulosonic acid transferase [Deltaproteobacteria bacterium]|nr:MAG: 3-deoxy-D-manno-octulosonic acid transferase [Deltaproteobacteria bacterium]